MASETPSLPATMKAIVAKDGKCVMEERPLPELTGRDVLVQIKFTAINRADTLQRQGRYPPPPGASDVLGLEMAGVIVAKGPECSIRLLPVGMRVMSILAGGGYAEYVAVDERLLLAIPDSMSFSTAAAIPETWLTAFQLLFLVGKLKADEWVLVHAAGSGVGTAAIQLATAAGAKVFAVAGSDEKLEVAKSLGAVMTANYKTEKFGDIVKSATGGAGADVILDCVGASNWEQNVEAAALDSRWVLYGLMGGPAPEGPVLAHILRKRIQLLGTTLRTRSVDYKANLGNDFNDHAIAKFIDGSYRPIIDRQFPLAEVQAAHDYMESNSSTGKIIIRVAEDAE